MEVLKIQIKPGTERYPNCVSCNKLAPSPVEHGRLAGHSGPPLDEQCCPSPPSKARWAAIGSGSSGTLWMPPQVRLRWDSKSPTHRGWKTGNILHQKVEIAQVQVLPDLQNRRSDQSGKQGDHESNFCTTHNAANITKALPRVFNNTAAPGWDHKRINWFLPSVLQHALELLWSYPSHH